MGLLFSAPKTGLPLPVIRALPALCHPADWRCPAEDRPDAQCGGPSCRLMVELGSLAPLLNNALINYRKLQRTQLTIIERSTEAARS